MTTNIWLNHLMQDIHSFLGVFSIDTLIDPKIFPSYTIINFSRAKDVGTHFVSLLFLNKRTCCYFDPLSLPFIPRKIKLYMFANSQNVLKINFKIQNEMSSFCGFFCLLPIMLHANNLSIIKGITLFEQGIIENDEICIEVLSHLFKMYYYERHPFSCRGSTIVES